MGLPKLPLALFGRIILSLLFLWAGLLKVVDPIRFLSAIRSYELLSDPYAAWLAMGLPWLEILAAIALWWSKTRPGALLVLIGLIVVFLVAILSALSRELAIDCGCFGDLMRGGYPTLIIQDIVLLGIACALLRREWRLGVPLPTPSPAS